jgi:hypothetical protein
MLYKITIKYVAKNQRQSQSSHRRSQPANRRCHGNDTKF